MIAVLALFFATAFPSNSKTSWMRPESFHLTIGMNRAAAVKALESNGWKTKKGDDAGQLVVDYADDKSLTLQFAGERLTSIRFELFTILQDAPKAFEEERAFLRAVARQAASGNEEDPHLRPQAAERDGRALRRSEIGAGAEGRGDAGGAVLRSGREVTPVILRLA